MKVLVCGGRDFNDKERVFEELFKYDMNLIIQGGASGADFLAKLYAQHFEIRYIEVKAEWKKYGKSAGMKRNREMLKYEPDLVIAFPGGNGTADMVNISKKAGIRVVEVREKELKI